MTGPGFRPTRAEIDLGAIRDNVGALRRLAGVPVMAVVKADAYGHGAIPVARAALEAGAEWLGVALVEEALELREAGIIAPILLLAEPPPDPDAADAVVRAHIRTAVYSIEWVDALESALARTLGSAPVQPVHMKIDTGMHRLGADAELAHEITARVLESPNLELEGVWTHLAVADDLDDPFTAYQVTRLADHVEEIRSMGAEPLVHAANSAGAIWHADARLDLVRCGISIYGLSPNPEVALPEDLTLRPAMTLVSEVESVRDLAAGESVSYGLTFTTSDATRLATIPIGYGDGYPRALSNNADVLIGGGRCPVVGTVTMDHILVDVGERDVQVGDPVVLIGRQGGSEIGAGELAYNFGSISYEVVTRISPRVPRTYRG